MRAQSWDLREFVYSVQGDILLDTSLGWAITGRTLLQDANHAIVSRTSELPGPNAFKWIAQRRAAERYDEVIWLPFGNGNYFHLLNDLIGGLALLRHTRAMTGTPVLISRRLWETSFFQELIDLSTALQALNWTPYAHDRWIRCSSMITAATFHGSRRTLTMSTSLLDRLPSCDGDPDARIFISRRPGAIRTPSNIEEVDAFFESRGFSVIYFEEMSVLEQRNAINSACYVAALHGAGMANLAFHERPEGVSVLEITPADYINPGFGYLSEELGMSYYCLLADPRDPRDRDRFHVPLDHIAAYLAATHAG